MSERNKSPELLPVQVRELKVAYQTGQYDGPSRPQIKLAGIWLERAGFNYGARIIICIAEPGRIIIESIGDIDEHKDQNR